jgi:hypothetical protein
LKNVRCFGHILHLIVTTTFKAICNESKLKLDVDSFDLDDYDIKTIEDAEIENDDENIIQKNNSKFKETLRQKRRFCAY